MPHSIVLLLTCCALSLCCAAGDVVLTPRTTDLHDLELSALPDGGWELRTTGNDPYFFVDAPAAIDLARTPVLAGEYISTTGIGRMLVFVGERLDIPHLITVPDVGRREGWAPLAIDLTATPEKPIGPVRSLRLTFGDHAGVVARVRGLCARPANEAERRQVIEREQRLAEDHAHTARLERYLATPQPTLISEVTVADGRVHISGRLPAPGADLRLAAVPLWQDITDLFAPTVLLPLSVRDDGGFRVDLPRIAEDGSDLLFAGWCVVRPDGDHWRPLSTLHYPDHVTPRADLPPARPRSRKGLGGCPFTHPDMEQLGVASVTLNIILNDLLHREVAPGRQPWRYAGHTWYSDEAALARYDEQMLTAARHGWMVSAIILLAPPRDATEGSWIRTAAHPQADPTGIFVMPDLASRPGTEAYAAALDLVAERYSRADGRYGRIHHWIMHNEIQNGFYWASAGTRSATTYLDLYQKSLRLAWLIASQYDANAKPLISLDHGWTAVPDPRAYAGRTLLDLLVRFSRCEGDFPWGVAFHPYPQDIADPRTWQDRDATFSVDTPFVTFRNLEVLDAWCRQPQVRYRGEPREIQLTEQGLNSPDYSARSLDEQAAGLAYAWAKIQPLTTISAFQYHLWADDHGEGGLRLGLRRYHDDAQDPHGIKPAWRVFQALGTDQEAAVTEFAKPLIGIHDWSEVPYRGVITGLDTSSR